MSAVLAFGTCVPGGGVQALADDVETQSLASQGVAASTGKKDQDAAVSQSGSQGGSGATTSTQDDKSSAAQATSKADKAPSASARAVPASLTAVYVDGANGNDANDGSSFDGKAVKTLAKALEIQAANKSINTIFVKGNLSLSAMSSIPSGVTLSVAS